MAVCNLGELRAALKKGQRLMGIDHGSKTLGLALSDVSLSLATPLSVIQRVKFTKDAETLIGLINKHEAGGLVFGLPVEMDGLEGPRCQSVRQFAQNLLEKIEIPIAFWDERLSTSAVERFLTGEADLSRKKRAAVVDRAAAAWILQGALDALGRTT
jgi:putative Holliday junction resolvase